MEMRFIREDTGGDSHRRTIRGNLFKNDGICTDPGVVANRDVPQNTRSGPDIDIVAEAGKLVAFSHANGDAADQRTVHPDVCRGDDDAYRVRDIESGAY